jgi:osmoprotectant transport system substrate-binding protein/osmoprotectant transport system permease protein
MTGPRSITLFVVHLILLAILLAGPAVGATAAGEALVLGSKSDVEEQILGAMLAHLARSAGTPATYERYSGTQLVWQALVNGQIDAYPEYTGTLVNQIFARRNLRDREQLRAALAEMGLAMSRPLGFNNTYAIGLKETMAEQLRVRTISDLAGHPTLRLGFSNEFMGRADGWDGLKQRYGLPFQPRGYEHALLYGALQSGALDAIELYSTDPQIIRLRLRVLVDDRGYFPRYDSVILYRTASARRAPAAFGALLRLEGQISEAEMVDLNAQVDEQRATPERAAATFLARRLGLRVPTAPSSASGLWTHARQHLFLVAVSLMGAILLSIPLGIVAARHSRVGHVVLAGVGVLQTVPSLALLVFMVPLLGLGSLPTIGALFLYSLLPIVRNTYAGLHDIPSNLRESAEALGLSAWARLRLIDLPLSARTILAGIKTAAVINVGTATVGGLIGAGGFGQPIVTGLALNDRSMILWQGAVPAAVLALAVQGFFDLAERYFVPEGLRLSNAVTGPSPGTGSTSPSARRSSR